jgi:hypothetical protein
MTNLEKAQRLAMGFCLSDYPEDWTYDQVYEALEKDEPVYDHNPNEDDDEDDEDEPRVTVWEPFEYLDVLEVMSDLVYHVNRLLDEKDKK